MHPPDFRIAYARDGFLKVKAMFSAPEIDMLRQEAARLFLRADLIDADNIRCRWQNHFETSECRFDCFDPVIDLSSQFEALARDARILELLAKLYGEPSCLFKDKLIFKPPGALGYGLHQDYIAWGSFPESFTTVIVALDEATSESGATEFFAGQHTKGSLSPKDGMYHELTTGQIDAASGSVLALEPGDVVVFSGFTPHRSGPNQSNLWRRQAYFSYNPLSAGGDCRQRHYEEFQAWLMERYAEYGKTNVFFR